MLERSSGKRRSKRALWSGVLLTYSWVGVLSPAVPRFLHQFVGFDRSTSGPAKSAGDRTAHMCGPACTRRPRCTRARVGVARKWRIQSRPHIASIIASRADHLCHNMACGSPVRESINWLAEGLLVAAGLAWDKGEYQNTRVTP